MGRIFLEHMSGPILYSCAACDANLSNSESLISKAFEGLNGRAFLFSKVVNLKYSDVRDAYMETGRYKVRDVSCKNCDTKLGWIFEFAFNDSERYKEGNIMLERRLIIKVEGLKNEI